MEKVIGITAEYNPFHKGHLHQLETLRHEHGDALFVATLSGAFVQRGMPALLDAWTRAEMAVRCGIDLVIELPVPFCCHNAGVFAESSVALLKACGCVSAISFGMEDEAELLHRISHILVQESSAFKAQLQDFLKKGFSYARSRAEATEIICPGAKALLEKPNNSLAVAYAESVLRQKAPFELLPIRRTGADYRDESSSNELMSASGIRAALAEGRIKTALDAVPEGSAAVFRGQLNAARAFLDETPLWRALRLLLLRSTPETLRNHAGVTEGIEYRLLEALPECESFSQFVETVATRRYPRSRVRRLLVWLLLGLSKDDDALFQARGPAYIRPLAMSERGRELLKIIRERGTLPVVSKPATLGSDAYAQRVFQLGLRASAIRESFLPRPDWKREISAAPFVAPRQSSFAEAPLP
ncbi:MAG: nucleotidyltransferase family protein [Pyramidobacter sp.]|nr:nucleotidyltransferase family protein [Pyramidobacter sp.]